jgi:CubicO group peptidase (beta-lactamase class C family)
VAAGLCAAVLFAQGASAAPPADLDRVAARAMSTFEVPGMAIAIVENGKPAVTRGYGVRKLGSAARVDEHTLFPIASNTKAFTTAALAILVDEGKLDWNDKVIDRLPGFRMYDAYATQEMTVRDLLVHHSGLGLGAGDLLFWPQTTLTRQEIVERLRFIKPATSFRSGYAYDNILYLVAGRLIEVVSGEPWEQFVERHIFKPLGMSESVASFSAIHTDNRAWPHARLSGRMRGLGPVEPLQFVPLLENSAPAGSINTSAADIARWLQVQLARGVLPDGSKRLFSAKAAEEMWTPETLIPIEAEPEPVAATTPSFLSYALGWEIRDYRGHKVVTHLGVVEGGFSVTFLIPEKSVGFIIMLNSEEDEARMAMAYRLLDHYLGLPARDWIAAYTKVRDERLAQAVKDLDRATAGTASGKGTSSAAGAVAGATVGPSLPLARYAGTYRDPWFGKVIIEAAPGGLQIRFDGAPSMHGALEHVRYDTFRTRFADKRIEDAYVTFALRPDGTIDQVKLAAISPLADFSFDYQDLLLTPQ